jgi:pimeloyl-ACP methyl ester carboxylesterase
LSRIGLSANYFGVTIQRIIGDKQKQRKKETIMVKTARLVLLLLSATLALGVASASAQNAVVKEFIQFPGGGQGLYWVPDSGPVSNVAFLVIHRTSDFLRHVSTQELPQRGYSVLGMNARFRNNEADVNWELIALDVRSGVRYLRSQPGIATVILIGHSGGGPTTSYYQAVAENGLTYCQGPNKLSPCSSEQLSGFEASDKADAIVFMDAHPSNTITTLRALNGAVRSEDNPEHTAAFLDPFSIKNGFNPNGDSVFSEQFVNRYSEAQSRRLNRLIHEALRARTRIEKGKHFPTDDDAFVFYRNNARLSNFSTGVHGRTFNPAQLLKNNGTVAAGQIVQTVRAPDPGQKEADATFDGVKFLTLTSFLSANAIRSTHSLNEDEIDWCSSNNSVPCAVASISVPILVMAMQGHYFIRDGEYIYETAASMDKEFIVVEGANHGLGPCDPCAALHNADYSNARTNMFNYIDDWVSARF